MQALTRTHKAVQPAGVIFCLLLTANVDAQIATDGSVGPAQNLSGPDFSIPEALGSRAGNNLFHSFQHFNILTGESATFTGASEIANVISRVTGGDSSTIDGILRSTIGQADFYFLNPAGVVFDANAQVDVPGSFYVSTADQLRFADGSIYHANSPTASTLSFDQPASFGFLGDQTASIRVEGNTLQLNPGQTLSLTGGELNIDNAVLSVERGDIQLVAVGDVANTFTIEGALSESAHGKLTVSGSTIEASGNGAGRIVIRSGASQIGSSAIFNANTGPTPAGSEADIDIHAASLELASSFISTTVSGQGQAADIAVTVAEELSIVNGGEISSNTIGAGDAGDVSVRAGTLTVDGQVNGSFTGVASQTQAGGDAGIVTVTVDNDVLIVNGGQLNSSTFGAGDAGQMNVKAGTLTVNRQGSAISTGIISQAERGDGHAGIVTVTVAGAASIVNGGVVSSSTFGAGDAGHVNVGADTLTVDGQGSNQATGIFGQADSGSNGKAGIVTVTVADAASIVNGGVISSSTFGANDAGQVNVKAGTLTVDGENSNRGTGIVSQSGRGSNGNAGIVTVTVDDAVSIVNGGIIDSSTFGTGDGGQIIVKSTALTIDGQGSNFLTGIVSNSNLNSSSKAGIVTVTVDDALSIVSGGKIASSTFGTGEGGAVIVNAGALTIDGQGRDVSTGIVSNTFLDLDGNGGDAGTVTVKVNNALSIVNGGAIGSSTFGKGNAGQVSVTADSLAIDGQGSNIFTGVESQANPKSSGNAGTVTVNVNGSISEVNRGGISSGTFGTGDAGDITVTAGALTADGQGSGIGSVAGMNSLGQTGNIKLDTRTLSLLNGAAISIASGATVDAATLATIEPTEINITAENITLKDSSITTQSFGNIPAGSITLNVADTLSLDPSRISTAANNADGGAISIQAKVVDLQDSQITTSVTGQGNGGDIDLTANVLVLDSGFIQANTAGANARGGSIRINTDALVASQNSFLIGGSTPLSFQPGLNVIQAAAPDGVSGSIDFTSPQLDISGDLTDLEGDLLDIDQVAQNPCATPGGRQSRLAMLGHGGLPETPEQAGSVIIDADRLQRLLPGTDATRQSPSAAAQPISTRNSTLTIEPLGLSPHAKTEC